MSSLAAIALGVSVLADVAVLILIGWWIKARKRIAGDTVGRAQDEAQQIRRAAERDAESLKKEAQLEAREKSHAVVSAADQQARARQQEIAGLDQALADRTRALADRMAATAALERDLRARDQTLAELQQRATA